MRCGEGPRSVGVAVLGFVVAFGATGCGVGPDEDDFSGGLIRRSFQAPIEYVAWWDEISACSGETGDLDDVRFFIVVSPLTLGGTSFPCGREFCNGIWEAPHDITLAPEHVGNETLVKHEMLHDLVRVSGHPEVFDECDVTWGNGSAEILAR